MVRTYPVSLVMDGLEVLVVGGGAVATRKVEGLLGYDVSITVVSPRVSEALRAQADACRIAWRERGYDARDVDRADIVFASTDDESINERVYRDARRARLFVNVADRPQLCSFFLPSALRRGRLSVAVSTEGASPIVARSLRKEIDGRIPAAFEGYLDLLAAWRPRVMDALPDEAARSRFWERAADGRVLCALQAEGVEDAERLLEGLLAEARAACEAFTGGCA